jgi:hypothetical protein
MNQPILLVAVIVVLVIAVAWLLSRRRQSAQLRTRFGSEYDRTLEDTGDRRAAESELRARQDRVAALDIRPLEAGDRDRYAAEWRQVQALFVDEPRAAIDHADELIGRVMKDRGYPVTDFERRVADVSVDHPDVVEHYRVAHRIASSADRLGTDTEDLRQAMVHYRALFEDLLGPGDDRGAAPSSATGRPDTTDRAEPVRRAS